jgi:YVTN family beta-propeller protein
MSGTRLFLRSMGRAVVVLFMASAAFAQAPSATILALAKSDHTLAIVDPATFQVLARLPAGPDPHEIIASDDGKLAFISNYGGLDSDLHTISAVDLIARKALPPIDLGGLRSAHGLAFAGGKLYFTVETNKVIGRYDPASQRVDWILGTGQDRTHMILVSSSPDQIVTSNVNSGTISIIEHVSPPPGGFAPPPGGPRMTWKVTSIPAGNGVEGFDITPDGKQVWAANARDGTVTIIDVATKQAIQTFPIPVKGANRLKFTPDGKRVLISGLGAGPGAGGVSLEVMDVSTRQEVKQLNLGGGAAGILIAPDGSRAYVAVSTGDKIAVVDLKTLDVVGQFSVGKQPDGLAWAVRK